MNIELAYSIHLGNDKNKTKRAKEIAKNNPSNTTSFSNNSIQNSKGLSKVNNHNLRKYDNNTELIKIIYGTNDLVEDVKNLYLQEFENARLEYNEKQTRNDRKIENYFDHISNNSNRDLACELIIELGDMEFWKDKNNFYKYKMIQVFNEQIEALQKIIPDFKLANCVIHFDETSPHLHIVGVPVKEGYKKGMQKQVAKSKIFTKESLTKLQEEMRNCCIKSFNKVYEQNFELKQKQQGRNQDIPVSKMTNYIQIKRQYERNKELREQANKQIDVTNKQGKDIKALIENLKPTLNKKNYTISKENVTKIAEYIDKVQDTTKNIKSTNEIDVVMTEYEKDLKNHNAKVKELNYTIKQKDNKIQDLTEDLNIAKDIISKQENKINFLQKELDIFKGLWNRLRVFLRNKVRYYKDESYKKVFESMKIENILRKEDIDFVEKKNGKNRKYEL